MVVQVSHRQSSGYRVTGEAVQFGRDCWSLHRDQIQKWCTKGPIRLARLLVNCQPFSFREAIGRAARPPNSQVRNVASLESLSGSLSHKDEIGSVRHLIGY